jgi:hypothetical protein
MRRALVVWLLAAVACGPQFPPPDTSQRQAPIPEGRAATAPVGDDAPAAPAAEARVLHVDHAWVKAPTPAEKAKRRKAIDALRTKVVAGETFIVAWNSLGENGDVWHVAEGETYDVEVIPVEARDLPVGQVSAVIPGDGGFHLFRILGRD